MEVKVEAQSSQKEYSVLLISRLDGGPISKHARACLEETGAVFDPALCGYVVCDGFLPASYSVFLPANGLTISKVVVDYDPEWFSAPEPPQVFEDFATEWDGCPPCSSKNGSQLNMIYCAAPDVNGSNPFLACWREGRWHSNVEPDAGLCPAEVRAAGWFIVATIAEALDMSCHRIDMANARRMSPEAKKAIVSDDIGSVLQVGLQTGRMQFTIVKE